MDHPHFVDHAGKNIGLLSVIAEVSPHVGTDGRRRSRFLCRCDCGKELIVRGSSLSCGNTRSCGCARARVSAGEEIAGREFPKFRMRKRPFEYLYNIVVNDSKRRHHSCELTYAQFLDFTTITACHYCGDEIRWMERSGNHGERNGYHLDRKDNDRGYSKDNCVVACGRCNKGRNNFFTYEEWLQIAEVIKTFPKKVPK